MTDDYRDLHGDAYKEWRDETTDEFVQLQRRAFLAGFEAAANESQHFRHLRQWVEEQRDSAKQKYDGSGCNDDMMHARYLTFKEVLVKLHEMGNEPEHVRGDGHD
jgi:hypothetical protein